MNDEGAVRKELCIADLSPDPFWRVPDSLIARMRSMLPDGITLRHVTQRDPFLAAIREASIIFAFPFPAHLVRGNGTLRWVHFWSAQVPSSWDRLRSQVEVTDSTGLNADSVVDHTMYLIYKALRREPFYQQPKAWRPDAYGIADDPRTLTLGIMGFGAIGRALAQRCQGLFRDIMVLSRTQKTFSGVEWYSSQRLTELLSRADYVVLALPLTPETRELLGEDFFSSLKPGATLINMGRGELVNETAIHARLAVDPDFRYLADVAAPEPYPEEGQLYEDPRVFLTPHIGGRRSDIWDALAGRTLDLLEQRIPVL
jgi:phosphoglycerate dehydrogenase-like enzyme